MSGLLTVSEIRLSAWGWQLEDLLATCVELVERGRLRVLAAKREDELATADDEDAHRGARGDLDVPKYVPEKLSATADSLEPEVMRLVVDPLATGRQHDEATIALSLPGIGGPNQWAMDDCGRSPEVDPSAQGLVRILHASPGANDDGGERGAVRDPSR